jgi:hypothetical protein
MSYHDDMSAPGGLEQDDEHATGDYELDDDLDPEGDSDWDEDEDADAGEDWDDSSSGYL